MHGITTIVVCVAAWSAEGRQATQAPPETKPAEKAGWWVRVNPATQAPRVYWRFGVQRNQLSNPMSWAEGTSPDALDVPAKQRASERLHVAAIAIPYTAPVSFCMFYGDRGVALIEFTKEVNVDVERMQTAEQCVP